MPTLRRQGLPATHVAPAVPAAAPVREIDPIWLATLLDQLPSAVIITDGAGRVVRANPAAKALRGSCYWPRFTGVHGDESDASPRPRATPIERLEWELARALLMGEQVRDERIDLVNEDGSRRLLSVSVAAVRDDAGQIVAGVVVCEDVTARERLETLTPVLQSLARL